MQVVHHSTYLLWFEMGRTALLEEIGFPYAALEREGTLFPVIGFECGIRGAADYGDVVRIETRVADLRSRSVVFSYRVTCRGEEIGSGKTMHVAMGPSRKAKRIPEPLLGALRRDAGFTSER